MLIRGQSKNSTPHWLRDAGDSPCGIVQRCGWLVLPVHQSASVLIPLHQSRQPILRPSRTVEPQRRTTLERRAKPWIAAPARAVEGAAAAVGYQGIQSECAHQLIDFIAGVKGVIGPVGSHRYQLSSGSTQYVQGSQKG